MIFHAKQHEIEAVVLKLDGQELAAVSINGEARLIPASTFNLFFAAVEPVEEPAAAEPMSLRGEAYQLAQQPAFRRQAAEIAAPTGKAVAKYRKPAGAADPKPARAKKTVVPVVKVDAESGMKTGEAVRKAIAEQPRMSIEIKDRVCLLMGWPVKDESARSRIHAAMKHLLDTNQAVKRTDPHTQLDHWFLTDGSK